MEGFRQQSKATVAAKKDAQEYPGQYPGDEKFAYRIFGHYPIDKENRTWRDKDAKRAGSGNSTRGEFVIVFVLLHLRKRYLAHGRCRCRARPTDSTKAGTGKDSGYGQAASELAYPGVGCPVKPSANSRCEGECSHKDEHWDNA